MTSEPLEPKLAKPGAGLPFIEWAMAKYILLPKLYKATDKEKAIEALAEESKKILDLARTIPTEQLSERRLVPRLRGMEDSSRFWSVAMTMDHLIIVGDLMRRVVVELSSGKSDLPLVGTAEVKPDKPIDTSLILVQFEQFTEKFLTDTRAANVNANPKLTHPHPWFGPLNALQWLAFAAPHENIHRQQIKEIITRL
jgi:hypothetical protein